MIDDTPVLPEPTYDNTDNDINNNPFMSNASSGAAKTLSSSSSSSSSSIMWSNGGISTSKSGSMKRPRRPPGPRSATTSSNHLSPMGLLGGASLSSSSAASTSSFKTSSKSLDQKLATSTDAYTTGDGDATDKKVALDFGTSDAPIPEGKRHVHVRANIWGMKLDKKSGLNKCGCQAYRIVVQDEVRVTIWILLLIAALVAAGFFIAKMVDGVTVLFFYNGYAHAMAATVAGIFSFLACVLTWLQISAHKRHWVHPASQRHVIRILLMVPVYAISAWLSLAFVKLSAYIDFVRNCYEAYVIWSFMLLLTEYLGGHTGVAGMMRIKLKQKWPIPMCCMPRAKPDSKFLWYLKYGALQYVIFSPIIAALTIILASIDDPNAPVDADPNSAEAHCNDYYCDGEFRYDRGFAYMSFMQNATQLLSLYTLAWLYILMKQELKPYKPVPKFLVVKAVVFFTFWQGIVISLMVKMGMLHATTNFDVGELQVGTQDFLVCVEMFIAAAVHKYTFGYETYVDGTFTILMEQRKKGRDDNTIPSGAHVRIINQTSEGKSIWEPRGTGEYGEEEPQVLTLIVEEPEGVPPALFDDDQLEDIDRNSGAEVPADSQSMSPVNRPVELEMVSQRPEGNELDHSEQGVDSLMDLVDD